jgi:hypothetical protein
MLRSLYEQNPSQVRISINLDAAVFLLRRSCVQVPIAVKTVLEHVCEVEDSTGIEASSPDTC